MPRAVDMPVIRDAMHIVPATTNPLGVKGVGEAATTGAIATVMSAVDDAIAGAPGALMEMPATAEKVWKAIQAATPQDVRCPARRNEPAAHRTRAADRWKRGICE